MKKFEKPEVEKTLLTSEKIMSGENMGSGEMGWSSIELED